MAKMNFKTLLLEKGEKLGIYAAAGLMVLLIVFAAYSAMDAKSPDDTVKGFKDSVQNIDTAIKNPNPQLPDVPDWAKGQYTVDLVDGRAHPTPYPLFDPIAQPDNKRQNPRVLPVVEFQTDFFAPKVLAIDITDDGRVGVLEFRSNRNQQAPNLDQWRQQFQGKQLKNIPKGKSPPPQPTGGPGFAPPGAAMPPSGGFGPPPGAGFGPPGGGSGYPGGSGSMPPGAAMGDGEGRMFPPGGMPGMGGYGGYGGYGAQFDTNAQRGEVRYVSLDDEQAFKGKSLALSIFPRRMVVIEAAFPYKEQLDEIRRALRLNSIADVFQTDGATPLFKGIDLERRMILPNGKAMEWQPLDYLQNYAPVYKRMVAEHPDAEDLNYVKMHYAHKLWMAYPEALQTTYPEVRMKTITDTIQKQKDLNKPPVQAKADNRLKGEGDVFAPIGAQNTGNNLFGNMEDAGMGAGGMNLPGWMRGKGQKMTTGDEGVVASTGQQEAIDYILVRVFDADKNMRPGVKYQYRMRVKMENPNFKKKEMMSRPSDADKEVLEGEWAEMQGTVGVPPESYLYVSEPSGDKKGPQLKDGQALLQVQRWVPQVQFDRNREPFGDWFVADVPVNRGTFVTGKQLVTIPLWSSERFNFVMRELPPEKFAKSKEPRRGVLMDLSRNDLLIVDIQGGKYSRYFAKPGTRPVDDEAAYEVLFLREDGTLEVRNSATDKEDTARKEREERWKKWVDEVEKNSKNVQPGTPAGSRFD
jgi:hypothetical protein